MISKVNDFNVSNMHNSIDTKPKSKKSDSTGKETNTSKVDALKASIDSGNYKINIKDLATRMANSLM
jgi:anti-sigma28 factor (negative regulator of flagellin synthesis)